MAIRGRKGVSKKAVREMIDGRIEGKTLQEVGAEQGIVPSTAYKLIMANWTPDDVEAFEKGKIARLSALQAQQMDIQGRPEIAEKIAIRFGANDIKALQTTINDARGLGSSEQAVQIQNQINFLNVDFDVVERKIREKEILVKKLMGEVVDVSFQGENKEDCQQECGNAGA